MICQEMLLNQGTKYIAADTDDQCSLPDILQYRFQFTAAVPGKVMAIHTFSKLPITISVKSLHQFVALVIDIRRRLVVVKLIGVWICLMPYHNKIVTVSKHPNGAGCFQTLLPGAGRGFIPCSICFYC